MYHAIVKKIARANFEKVNNKDYESLLADCAPDIRHKFAGTHALGGIRHDREALRLWFGRLGRVIPKLHLDVQDVWVTGWPNDTTVVVSWEADATLNDGSPYKNRGVHIIKMRWGTVIDIDAHEDSQAVAVSLITQAANGISEAAAEPIVS